MPTPGLGHKSYIQIGKESTYGTAVAATKKFECISMDISPVIGTIEDPSLYAQPSRRGLYQGGILYRGRFTVRCNYEGLLKLFEGVFGSGATTGPAETVVYTHTFKEASALPSYTIEMIEGDIGAGLEQELVGAKFTTLRVRGTAGQGNDGMVICEFEVLAKDKVVGQTPTGALSFPSVFPVLFHQPTAAGVLEGSGDSAANVRVRTFEVELTNSLADDRFYLGAQNIDEPIRNDFLEARWRFTQEFVTTALFVKAKAFTTGALKLLFQHPSTIGSTLKREFEIRSGSANLVEYSNPVEAYGVVIANSTWRAFYDPTDLTALLARFQNLETAI